MWNTIYRGLLVLLHLMELNVIGGAYRVTFMSLVVYYWSKSLEVYFIHHLVY